ncbi:MAG: hypothetical protein KME29_37090 [Calothrix sp. FI2-JRJ7]|jgi:hypothetical protein|nr:hypothetical protein [Calothrix sp. FI2-JRJ7]
MNPLKLLLNSFTYTIPIYGLLLLLTLPSFILDNFLVLDLSTWLKFPFLIIIIYLANLILSIWIVGAVIYYVYHYLTKQKVSIIQGLQHSFKKIEQLILGSLMCSGLVLLSLILLVIPGVYILVKFNFFPYAIVIENCTAKEGINRSSDLVRGYWWSVFLGILVILLLTYFPNYLSSQIILKLYSNIEDANAEMIGNILGFLVSPFRQVYHALLFIRLQRLSSH